MIVTYSGPATEPLTIAEVMAHCRIDSSSQEPAPGAITAALASVPVAGNVDNGAHRYLATFVTATGETQAGTVSSVVTVSDKTVNGKVELSAIPIGGALVTSRKIYRTTAGGSTYLLLTTIANNTDTTYTDNTADASLGAGAPSTNTTSDSTISVLIKAAREAAENELHRYLITQTLDAYFDEFPDEDETDYAIILPPMQSATVVITYVDTNGVTQTLASDQYQVDIISKPSRITPAYGCYWPSTRDQPNAVKVRFTAGYGSASDVPACIKHWMKVRIAQMYDHPDPLNVGTTATESPYPYIDGLLDPERVSVRI